MLSIIGSVLGVTATVVALWQTWLRWRAHGVEQLRGLADSMRTIFGDVVALNGVDSATVTSGSGLGLETNLTDLHGQLRDRKLRDRVEALRMSWRETFANAPPPFLGAAWVGPGSSSEVVSNRTPAVVARIERQVEAARAGQAAVQRLLDRCNELTRPIVFG